jgi:hypothetical protein
MEVPAVAEVKENVLVALSNRHSVNIVQLVASTEIVSTFASKNPDTVKV